MKRIPRRLLSEEFKKEAIKLVTEQSLNVALAGYSGPLRQDNNALSLRG